MSWQTIERSLKSNRVNEILLGQKAQFERNAIERERNHILSHQTSTLEQRVGIEQINMRINLTNSLINARLQLMQLEAVEHNNRMNRLMEEESRMRKQYRKGK